MNLGSYSFCLMVIILGITLLKLFPYDKWKIIHKCMSLVFIGASLHFFLSDKLFGDILTNKALLSIPCALGLISIMHRQIVQPFFLNYPIYEVTQTKKVNYNTVEVFLRAKKKALSYIPGQYAFFQFTGKNLSHESHPFTLWQS